MLKTPHMIMAACFSFTTIALTGCDNQADVQPLESAEIDETPADTNDQVQAPAERGNEADDTTAGSSNMEPMSSR